MQNPNPKSQPVIVRAQAPPYREVQRELQGKGFFLSHVPGLFPYKLTGHDPHYRRIQVLLRDADHARQFIHEIDPHLSMPAPWHAPFPTDPNAPAWVSGYIAARQHCIPANAPFRSVLSTDHKDLPLRHHTPEEQIMFRRGARYYLQTVRNILHDLTQPEHPEHHATEHHATEPSRKEHHDQENETTHAV